jgi:hypothetical protein
MCANDNHILLIVVGVFCVGVVLTKITVGGYANSYFIDS